MEGRLGPFPLGEDRDLGKVQTELQAWLTLDVPWVSAHVNTKSGTRPLSVTPGGLLSEQVSFCFGWAEGSPLACVLVAESS